MREEAAAIAVEYLWQADGPLRGDRGVCGDLAAAMLAAEGCLRGGARSVVIDEATPGLVTDSMDDGYCRTGRAWRARAADDGIAWVPPQPTAAEAAHGRNLKWPRVYSAALARIEDRSLKPGEVVSIADLGPEFRVGRKTVAKAVAALEAEGLLERRPGIGYVVLERAGPEPAR